MKKAGAGCKPLGPFLCGARTAPLIPANLQQLAVVTFANSVYPLPELHLGGRQIFAELTN